MTRMTPAMQEAHAWLDEVEAACFAACSGKPTMRGVLERARTHRCPSEEVRRRAIRDLQRQIRLYGE